MNLKELKYKYMMDSLFTGAFISIVAGILTVIELSILNLILPINEFEKTFILSCILAPITEEILKPLGLLYCRNIAEIFGAKDWMVMGALSGLGFAVLENAIYSLHSITGGRRIGYVIIIYRTFTTLPMHMFTSSIVGLGLGLILSKKFRFLSPILYFIAIILHSLYNYNALRL